MTEIPSTTAMGRLLSAQLNSGQSSPEWPAYIVGENQAAKLAELSEGLQGYSPGGGGKQITSGFSYWGVLAASAWGLACADPIGYKVAGEGIRTFSERWPSIYHSLEGRFHYVSLGPGDGQKDAIVLSSLRSEFPEMLYCPVDMSMEMLGLSFTATRREVGTKHTLGVQLDFSSRANLQQLRRWLDAVLCGEPTLFSLLGNSLANIEDDTELLRSLSEELLKSPEDRLLVELATAGGTTDNQLNAVKAEYRGSNSFRKWVLSALFTFTNVPRNLYNLDFCCESEGDRAIRLTVSYKNPAPEDTTFQLFNLEEVPFAKGEFIRVELTRKYLREGIASLLSECELERADEFPQLLDSLNDLGLNLLLLCRQKAIEPIELTPALNGELEAARDHVQEMEAWLDQHVQELTAMKRTPDVKFPQSAEEKLQRAATERSHCQELKEQLAEGYAYYRESEVNELIAAVDSLYTEVFSSGRSG